MSLEDIKAELLDFTPEQIMACLKRLDYNVKCRFWHDLSDEIGFAPAVTFTAEDVIDDARNALENSLPADTEITDDMLPTWAEAFGMARAASEIDHCSYESGRQVIHDELDQWTAGKKITEET